VEQRVNIWVVEDVQWEDKIQLNRELPALTGEMCVSQGLKSSRNKGVRGVREKFRGEGARSRIELMFLMGRE